MNLFNKGGVLDKVDDSGCSLCLEVQPAEAEAKPFFLFIERRPILTVDSRMPGEEGSLAVAKADRALWVHLDQPCHSFSSLLTVQTSYKTLNID